jgi:hypothetical protein
MQYGASQVFGAARILAVKNPGLQIQVSPNWTFQAENVRSFFVDDVPNIIIGTPDAYIDDFKPDLDNKLFVLTPDDYQHVLTANRFKIPVIDQIIKYPNQQPGFYFVRLAYRDDIQTILQQEKQLRHQLVHGQITLNGELVDIGYSKLDGMSIENAFDGSLDSHIKTYDANPLELDLVFPKPRMMEGLTVKVGGEPVNLSADVYADNVSTPIHYEKLATEVAAYKNVRLDFNPAMAVKRIHITILDVDAPDPSPVHLWEVTFNYPPQ